MDCTDSLSEADDSVLMDLLSNSDYNWFEFVKKIEDHSEHASNSLESFFLRIPHMDCNHKELALIVQSHRAFLATQPSYEEERQARIVNGEIVSESESDDPEDYVDFKEVRSEKGKLLVQKKHHAIRRRAKRLSAKHIAEKRFLSKKVSSRTSKILND